MNKTAREKEARRWRAFQRNASEHNHEALWTHYQPLVRFIADKFSARFHDDLEPGELIDAGNVGLLDAIAEFDPGENNRFEILAVPRIRGSIARSLAVRQARETTHVLRLELAEAIALAQATEEVMPREIVLQFEVGRRERASAK